MSGREWKPGDVAMVRVENAAECRAVLDGNCDWLALSGDDSGSWISSTSVGGEEVVTPLHSLLVIDPEDRDQAERLLGLLMEHTPRELRGGDRNVWDQQFIDGAQAALRALANPQPPKPDEPTGLGAVVEDSDQHLHTLARPEHDWPWVGSDGKWRSYDQITAVKVLSLGVTP